MLAHGFLRVYCDACGHDRLVAFSCKGRGFCPSCGGRRMAEPAAHLVDRVLPEVPIRQWVLTLPYPLRYRCAWNARLMSDVLGCFLRALFANQRRWAKWNLGVRNGLCGSVTFIQRFGSALNLTPHFHGLVLDGVYEGPRHAPGRFHVLDPPETADVARVLSGTARRIRRLLESSRLAEETEDPLREDDPLMAMLGAASIRSRIATGPEAGSPWRRLGDRVESVEEEDGATGVEPAAAIPPRCVREGGMSLHADVAVPARDRRRLERLCRYVARPPLALDRLEELGDGRLAYRLKTPWRDGTTHVVMERWELLERLAPLIPPPRSHQVRYHGVLAPCASGRDQIVPGAGVVGEDRSASADPTDRFVLGAGPSGSTAPVLQEANAPAGALAKAAIEGTAAPIGVVPGRARPSRIVPRTGQDRDTGARPAKRVGPPRRTAWADLLERVFEVDALRCPECGGRMRVLAAIIEPDVARRILACLDLPSRAPPLRPYIGASWTAGGRSAPERTGSEWDESASFDFDQSLRDDAAIGGDG